MNDCRSSLAATVLVGAALLTGCGSRGGGTATHEIHAESGEQVEFRVPASPEPAGGFPLLIALHGRNKDENQPVQLWDEGMFVNPDFVLAAPRGPFNESEGFGWSTSNVQLKQARLGSPERWSSAVPVIEERINRTIETARKRFHIDERRIYLLGYSDGARAALMVGLRHPGVFSGVAADAGSLDPGNINMDSVAGMKVMLVVGKGEGVDAVNRMQELRDSLVGRRAVARVHVHDGGHVITTYTTLAVQEFMGLIDRTKPLPKIR